jgi:hypothetical protein
VEHHDKVEHPSNYNAMRIDGDGEDHLHEPPVCSSSLHWLWLCLSSGC